MAHETTEDTIVAAANAEYRNIMDFPVEQLAVALWGLGNNGPKNLHDHEIVERAARKITTLKKMILATGFNENMLNAIMGE